MKTVASRFEPLQALIWLEAVAAAVAFGTDLVLATASPSHGMMQPWFLYAITAVTTGAAVFSIPHAPNRRFASAAIAAFGLAATEWLPPHGLTSPVLSCVLAARLTFAFGPRGAAAAWAMTIAALVVDGIARAHGTSAPAPTKLFLDVFANAVIIGLIFGVIAVLWWYARSAAAAAASGERAKIALDLHDSFGHVLTTLSAQMENAQRLRADNPEKADAYLQRAAATVTEMLGDVRGLVGLLRSPDQDASSSSFVALLDRLHSELLALDNVYLEWSVCVRREPPGRVAIAIYRILQEALTNVVRHARAGRVLVEVTQSEHDMMLRVDDDGCGCDLQQARGHGLASMRARTESLGGTMSTTSQIGEGTHVFARIPLESRP